MAQEGLIRLGVEPPSQPALRGPSALLCHLEKEKSFAVVNTPEELAARNPALTRGVWLSDGMAWINLFDRSAGANMDLIWHFARELNERFGVDFKDALNTLQDGITNALVHGHRLEKGKGIGMIAKLPADAKKVRLIFYDEGTGPLSLTPGTYPKLLRARMISGRGRAIKSSTQDGFHVQLQPVENESRERIGSAAIFDIPIRPTQDVPANRGTTQFATSDPDIHALTGVSL